MAKKLWEILHEEAENNQQNRAETVRQANQQFNDYTSKKGTYDTTKHTTTIGDLKKAYKNSSNYNTVKKSLDNYYRNNENSLWNKIKTIATTSANGNNRFNNQNNVVKDNVGKIDTQKTIEKQANQNFETVNKIKRTQSSNKSYQQAKEELLKSSLSYKQIKLQNPNASDEELLKIAQKNSDTLQTNLIKDIASKNGTERTTELKNISTSDKNPLLYDSNKFRKMNNTVLQYKTTKEAQETAEKINNDLENGKIGSSVGHILEALPQKTMEAVASPIYSTGSLLNLKLHKGTADQDLQDWKAISSKYDKTTANINSDVVKTASNVSGTIGYMVPSILASVIAPETNLGRIIQGTSVGGQGYIENLNDDASNKFQSAITGLGKGYASYAIEGITGGNILGKGSLDDLAVKTIASKTSNNASKKIASMIYEVGGEVFEEEVENQTGYLIDKIVNDKGISLKDWLNEQDETVKNTVLSTLVLKVLGLGGSVYNDVENYNYNAETKKWINEAEKIIQKENLTIDLDKFKVNNNIKEVNNVLKQLQQENDTPNSQLQSIQEQQILPTQQINQEQNKVPYNGNMEQINNFNGYTLKEINNIESKNIKIANSNEDIINFIRNSKKIPSNAKLYISKISNKVSTAIKNKLGINVDNYNISMTSSFVNHVLNGHGNNITELSRGQIALTENDFGNITEIINNPDNIVNAGLNKDNKQVIQFEKNINGNNVVVTYVSDKHHNLELQTMYKFKNDKKIDSFTETNEINSLARTSKTDSDTNLINNSIPQNTNSVKNNTINNDYIQNNENNTQNSTLSEKNMMTQKTLNPTEISNITAQDANTTPVLPTRNYKKGNKESSFFSNVVTDAKFLNKDLRQEMAHDENIRYYKGITNQETLEKAYSSLNEEGKNATLNWFNKDTKNVTAEDVAKGWILLKQYQDNGDYKSAVETAKKMRDMATGAGQTVQAYNILSRLTPEGMFYYAQSELNEAYNKMVEGKSQKWIEENRDKFDLTPEETKFIMDNMNEVANMEDGYEKKVKIAEIQKIVSDKIPPTLGQSVKTWMRISMLFNPKTQVRNISGNAVILPVNATSDFISSGLDKLISKKTGVRTTGNINLKNYTKGFGKGLYESYNDFRKGINTRNIEGNRFEVSEGRNFKNKGIGKALNRVDSLLSFMLDAGDRGFYEATFTNSINNQLVLNNTTEVTQEMIDIATNEALQRTWQDNNKYTEAVLKIRNILNYANVKGYGLGDVIIPFAKTPANLTKAIVDYSPVGLVKAMTLDARTFKNSLENGQFTPQIQHKFVQNLGKGMAGSFLYVLGYALAKAGIASGEADDDKDVKNFMKNSLGISSYSIKIGDKTFTYDWAQPVATPLAIMTNYVKYSEENPDANIIEKGIKSLNIGTEQLLEQSFMESLNTVLNGNGTTLENLSQSILELPARAVPTFSKQIADMVDGTQRTSFEYDKPLKSAVNSVIAKIPFASKTLPVSRDTLGNEIKKYGGENNLWNVMFNPANVNKGELSKAGEEVYRLYQETGETTIFPITAPYYINSNGEKITMTAEERSDYQKVTGEYTEKAIEELLSNSSYKKLTDGKKAELITDIISDSNAKAKHDILNVETEEAKKKRELIEKVTTKNYYDYRLKTKDIEGEDATRRKNEVLLDANYSNNAKSILYTNTTGKEDSLYSILNNGNIDIDEYLEYKIKDSKDEFAADKDKNGNSISGSSKKKVYSYVNNNITGVGNRLIILGSKYKLQNSERQALTNYINKTVSNNNDKLEIFKKLSKNYTVKNGKVYYK